MAFDYRQKLGDFEKSFHDALCPQMDIVYYIYRIVMVFIGKCNSQNANKLALAENGLWVQTFALKALRRC